MAATGNGRVRGDGSGRGRGGRSQRGPVRYAVVGLGHIAQRAVLPAFANAKSNSRLAALVSGDAKKRRVLGKRYGVTALYDYDEFGECVNSGAVDAVYIATPNALHLQYAEAAARAGVHVLCEKPLEADADRSLRLVRTCEEHGVRLMTAYRLHFEAANLEALKLARSGKLGELRAFNSMFTMRIKSAENIRLDAELGGGPLADIGIYCINAARTIFAAEPEEVFAWGVKTNDPKFTEVEETVAAVLRFPEERAATFVCSFNGEATGWYEVVGTKGKVRVDPAYEYKDGLGFSVTINDKTRTRKFKRRDQFAAELLHFSECVIKGRKPGPSGWEGVADVRVIDALRESMATGAAVKVGTARELPHPTPDQRIDRPAPRKPKLVKAEGASE